MCGSAVKHVLGMCKVPGSIPDAPSNFPTGVSEGTSHIHVIAGEQ